MSAERVHARLPLSLQVEYRTASAFLVAYSVNLSAGGMFVETLAPHPIGTELTLRFAVPGVEPVEIHGVVAWTRAPGEEGKPPGMGVRFSEALDSRYGELIDRLAAGFRGLRVVVMAATPGARAVLVRGVRSLLENAIIVEAADSTAAEAGLEHDADLALVDLDDAGAEGLVTLRLAKVGRRPIPVIATARDDAGRVRGADLGADLVIASPPLLSELQAAVIRALVKPSRVG